jgi:hypothetical protein
MLEFTSEWLDTLASFVPTQNLFDAPDAWFVSLLRQSDIEPRRRIAICTSFSRASSLTQPVSHPVGRRKRRAELVSCNLIRQDTTRHDATRQDKPRAKLVKPNIPETPCFKPATCSQDNPRRRLHKAFLAGPEAGELEAARWSSQ